MANILDFGGVRALTSNAQPGDGYVAKFYVSGTTTPVTVYTDDTLGTAHGVSVTADAAGRFPAVWSSGGAIKCVIEDANGATVETIDPVISVAGGGQDASDIAFTPTVALPYTDVQAAIEGAVAVAASGYAAFGIGITGNAALLANLDATNVGAGLYRFDGTTTGTYPTGVAAADTGLIEQWRQSATVGMMELHHATTNRRFRRRLTAGVWGAWRENVEVNIGATRGDMIRRGASDWERFAIGASGRVLTSDGTDAAWAAPTGRVLLATKTASASATLDFTEFDNAVYRFYEFEFENLKPATDGVALFMRFSTNAGSSYDGGASDYEYANMLIESGDNPSNETSTSSNAIALIGTSKGIGNVGTQAGVNGTLKLYNAGLTGGKTRVQGQLSAETATLDRYVNTLVSGYRKTAQDTDAVRFLMTSGNITSGVIRMYGVL